MYKIILALALGLALGYALKHEMHQQYVKGFSDGEQYTLQQF